MFNSAIKSKIVDPYPERMRKLYPLSPKLEEFIARMPKVELHLHLEGSISPATALYLAERNRIALPQMNLAGIKKLYYSTSFGEFLDVFMFLTRVIVKREDFELLAYETGMMLAKQHTRYAEVMISPMQHLLRGIPLLEAVKGVADGFRRAEQETGIKLRIAFDYGRQYGPDYAWYVLEVAKEARRYGVIAWSIGGDEIHYPPEPFAEVFAAARAAGLHLMAHAGEVAGPASVWGAVHALHVERIGHGIRSVEDPRLVDDLRERGIALDICPSSNVRTGAVRSWCHHTLRHLYNAGVLVTINSDDPPFFDTTLTDEYRRIVRHFGFNVDDLCVLALNGVRASFLPPPEKAALLNQMEQELAALRKELEV